VTQNLSQNAPDAVKHNLTIVNGHARPVLVACVVPMVPMHRRVLGEKVRTYRKRAKLTQERLAEKTGLSVVFISLLENGWRTVSVDSLLRIARALKVRIEDLVSGMK
jgi:DNA-binding XRE family transcriptional regulator